MGEKAMLGWDRRIVGDLAGPVSGPHAFAEKA